MPSGILPQVGIAGAICLVGLLVANPTFDAPLVEILASEGAVGAESSQVGAGWDRVRLQLQVVNRLAIPVDDLVVEVTLVSSADKSPIPGWRIEQRFAAAPLSPQAESEIFIDRPLPAQRRPLRADAIAYQPTVVSYRLVRPNLDVAVTLLGSGAQSDQRAALATFEHLGDDEPKWRERLRIVVRRAFDRAPSSPTPTDALKLLLALHAASRLDDPHLVAAILELAGRVDATAWGAGLIDLAERMVEGSDRDEPRLSLLPLWARNTFDKDHRSGRALQDVLRGSILRMGDVAVPPLVWAATRAKSPTSQALATSLLHALGRSTIRSQLALTNRSHRLRLIEVYGELGGIAPVHALTELVVRRDPKIRTAAMDALKKIGPAAVDPLVDALGTPDEGARAALLSVLVSLAPIAAKQIARTARRYGVAERPGVASRELIDQLAIKLADATRSRWQAELERGLELGRQRRYDEAFRVLDAVYAADSELYMSSGERIAEVYSMRAHDLYDRGNFDAAASTARVGQSIAESADGKSLLVKIQAALAEGYLDLDALEKAEEALAKVDPGFGETDQVRALRARLLRRRAELAFGGGDYGRARNMIDRARTLAPLDDEVGRVHYLLLARENFVILVVLGLIIPAALLGLAVRVRRKIEARRLQPHLR